VIVFVQGTYGERIEQTLKCLERIAKAVDKCVIVVDQTVTEEQKEILRKSSDNVEAVYQEWVDDFPLMRNRYLDEARKRDEYAWVVVSDPDEIFCEEFCKDLRRILEEADKQGIGLLLINSHDITVMPDGTKQESISNFFKNLIFKLSPDVRYQGVGAGKVHETLLISPGTKSVSLPRKYYYEHHKTMVEIWERAFRNVWIAGGGNNVCEKNPRWQPLREITDRLGLKSWPEVREYLRRGNIDKELLEWIRGCQRESGWDWQNEMFDCLKYYRAIHGEELPDIPPATELTLGEPAFGSPPEVMRYVEETYKSVLGRHADDRGKQHYTALILSKQIRREDLPRIFMMSTEFTEKFPEMAPKPPTPTQHVQLPLPVNVQVGLSEEHVERALMRSDIYWKVFKPRLDFAKKWEEVIAKVKVPSPKPTEAEINMFKAHVPPSDFLHILAFNLETAEALDKAGYRTVINVGETTDIHSLPLPDQYFDAVYCVGILQYALAPFLAISEINRVLKEGGRVMVSSYYADELMTQFTDFKIVVEREGLFVYEKKS